MNLRKVMQWDAWATGVSTLLTIVAAPLLGSWLDVSMWIPLGVGVALVPWTAFLADTARRVPLVRWQVAAIATGNLAWVAAAVVLVFGFPDALSTTGRWMVGVFSLAVLDFGLAQMVGLRNPVGETQTA